MKLQVSHHGQDGRDQAPPAVQTGSYRLDKATSYDSNLGNAELVPIPGRVSRALRRTTSAPGRKLSRGFDGRSRPIEIIRIRIFTWPSPLRSLVEWMRPVPQSRPASSSTRSLPFLAPASPG